MNWRRYVTYPLICAKSGSREHTYLRVLENTQFLSRASIEQQSLRKLRALLIRAAQDVPYYTDIFRTHGFDPSSCRGLTDLHKIPLLSKKIMQEEYQRLFSIRIDGHKIIYDQTGGSTGVPTRFAYTEDRLDWRKAAARRHDKWAGLYIGERLAILWGARQDFAANDSLRLAIWRFLTSNHLVLDTSSLTEETIRLFIRRYKRFKPQHILAYAQSLEYFCTYIRDHSVDLPPPRSIITSAELLTPARREYIQSTLSAPIFDRYGARETALIASECEHHTMHIHDEGIHVECVGEDGRPCVWGEEGELIVTDLLNHAFPLIRYRIGDTGMLLKDDCPCGRGLSALRIVSGRTSDFIVTPRGRKVSGAAITAYVCAPIEGFHRVQFYQKDNQSVQVRMVPNNKFSGDTVRQFVDRARTFLDEITVECEVVDEIPVPVSGKHQFVVSDLLKSDRQ